MRRYICSVLVMVVALWLQSCASTDVDQACRPEIQTGCPIDEFCTIKTDGASMCVPNAVGRLSEGDLCEGVESRGEAESRAAGICAPGLGCFLDGTFNRCLRFCVSSATDQRAACQNKVAEEFAHPFGERSECSLRVYERNEIGACRLGCTFGERGEAAGCVPDSTCGLTPDLYEARCLPEGDGAEGNDCNLSCPCAGGLVCVPEVSSSRCRRAVSSDGCGDDAFRAQVPGTRDVFLSVGDDWVPYEYCPKCISFAVASMQQTLSLCAFTSCDASDTLADLNGIDRTDIVGELSRLLGDDYRVVVGLERRGSAWYWPSGETPVMVEGSDGDGSCAALDGLGTFRLTQECSGLRLCQMSSSLTCAAE